MPWGEIPQEHIEMDHYPADPSAPGVVLGSLGKVEIGQGFRLTRQERRRVKVFNEGAYDHATISIVYRHAQRAQRLRGLEGQTFVPDGAGGMTRVALDPNDIHEERDGDFTVVRFTMPALEPGAIFEYRYRVENRGTTVMIPDWTFQETLPVIWSEYRARFPEQITLSHHLVGDPEFTVAGIDAPPGASRRWRSTFRWVMENVPAIRDEPYVSSIWNYAYAIQFELARLGPFNISQSWAEVDRAFHGSRYFGARMESNRTVRDLVAELTAGARTDRDKAFRIYDHVRREIEWDGRYRRAAMRATDDVLEAGWGTSGEINMVLLAMLREAGIEANPFILSTRGHGEVQTWFVSVRQFNHVMAHAVIDGEELFLDATDEHRPMGMLPVAAINGHGRLLAERNPRWIRVEPQPSVANIEIEGAIDENGRLSGVMTGHFEGYSALSLRQRLAEAREETEEVDLDDEGHAIVDSDELRFTHVEITDALDDGGPVTFEAHFEAMEAGQAVGHLVTVDPVLVGRLERNPFPDADRRYPVDFAFPVSENYTARFTLPDGFEYDELPPHVRLQSDGGGLTYGRVIMFVGGVLQVRRIYDRRDTVFPVREYASLREVFDGITAADAQMVVLARTQPAELAEDDSAGD